LSTEVFVSPTALIPTARRDYERTQADKRWPP